MTINYSDLRFSLAHRALIVSYPARNLQCLCDVNEDRNQIVGAWMPGLNTLEARSLTDLFKDAGNEYLAGLKNDTRVFDALDDEHIWRGVGTPEAIKARGYKLDRSSLRYCPKEWLVDGWTFIALPAFGPLG